MKSKTILGADGATKMRQITVGIHGKGGEAGIKAIHASLQALVNELKAVPDTAGSIRRIFTDYGVLQMLR